MASDDRPKGGPEVEPPGQGEESEFSIARSRALAPLLVLSALTVLAILAVVLRAKPLALHAGAAANVAYGPSDFPALFGAQESKGKPEAVAAAGASAEFPVPPPPFSEDIYPCSECHADMEPNPERRELEDEHTDIVLEHDQEHRWCLDCHDATDRDNLRLASGALVPFTESYRLCGQCHGTQYRDWRTGVHGKRLGYWNGPKRYLLCVHCHNPHSPRFASLKPLPPPIRPQYAGERHPGSGAETGADALSTKEGGDAVQTH